MNFLRSGPMGEKVKNLLATQPLERLNFSQICPQGFYRGPYKSVTFTTLPSVEGESSLSVR
jgi:hypothetical protein